MNVQPAIPPWLQWAWAIAGLIVAFGGILWVLVIVWPYLRFTRGAMATSLKLGEQTAQHIDRLQKELTPVITDLKGAVSDARAIVGELRAKELDKVVKVLDRIVEEIDKVSQNGTIEEAIQAVKEIPKKLDLLTAEGRKKALKSL